MSDIVKNIIQNIVYPFYIKGNDFKELNLKEKDIKDWIDKNGQEWHRVRWSAKKQLLLQKRVVF